MIIGFVDFTRLEGMDCFNDDGEANFYRFSAISAQIAALPRIQPLVGKMAANVGDKC
jgi:hypothetical protein